MEIIRTVDLTKNYYPSKKVVVRAVRDVNLRVEEGEFVAIMGPSGSGKSTLLYLLGCLLRPTRGEYYLNGVEVSELKGNDLARHRNRYIGFVFQDFNLLSRYTALENVMLPMIYGKVRRRKERAMELLERVGLGDRAHHRPTELSGGQQQRVAIARALAMEPKLLLADEPTGNLDTLSGAEIMALFQELNEQGKTVVMVTHDPLVAKHASRIVRMRDGKVIEEKEVSDRIDAKKRLEELRKQSEEEEVA